VRRQATHYLEGLNRHDPVRRLRALVVSGPDEGKSAAPDADILTVGTADGNDLCLSDETVSRYHLELSTLDSGIRVVDCGSTNGTRLGTASIERALVQPDTVLTLGRTTLRIEAAERAVVELHPHDALGQIRGRSRVMRRLMARLEKLAQSEASVLLIGESGTGKDLVARALHEGGPRASEPFITVDCGALAPTLTASELFGHERGAFTGADRQHVGAFERAERGSVFLDEVGELSPELQAHLLGVLERRRIRRVGGQRDIAVDVRVLAATNRDLRADVNSGTFRLDLYYRLAVVSVEIPPLRERAQDVPLLVEHLLSECGYEGEVESLFPTPVMQRLIDHRWPGNVRELRNIVEATLATGEAASPDGSEVTGPEPSNGHPSVPILAEVGLPYKDARNRLLHEFEARYLGRLLERCGDNVSRAAREACMTRSHLFDLLRRHNLR
jgi:DNA-binding NtrC family response regulator